MEIDERISDEREWTKAKKQKSMGCIPGIVGQNHRVYEVEESLENLTCVQSDCEYRRMLLYRIQTLFVGRRELLKILGPSVTWLIY